ncbi:hypothetical protein DVS77_16880 [Mycolicibacterium moriokaense]|nr:hypothetical protein DVS77_16880 [Mycolicibacterium moriokaense]
MSTPTPTPAPDPHRIGGLAWAQRTKGRLTAAERRRLLGSIATGLSTYVAGRVKAATGRVPPGARDLSATALTPPDSRLARVAEEACREQPAPVIGHGYRTWMFGAGLAALDESALDMEHFYAACLLHDYGIAEAVDGEDFTLRSARRLLRCAEGAGLEPDTLNIAADAVTVHATPGITVERDGALGVYIQQGAMFDLAGLRLGDLTRGYRHDVITRYPRDGVSAAILPLIAAEASANPDGRFALLRRCGLPMLVRMNPIRPR